VTQAQGRRRRAITLLALALGVTALAVIATRPTVATSVAMTATRVQAQLGPAARRRPPGRDPAPDPGSYAAGAALVSALGTSGHRDLALHTWPAMGDGGGVRHAWSQLPDVLAQHGDRRFGLGWGFAGTRGYDWRVSRRRHRSASLGDPPAPSPCFGGDRKRGPANGVCQEISQRRPVTRRSRWGCPEPRHRTGPGSRGAGRRR